MLAPPPSGVTDTRILALSTPGPTPWGGCSCRLEDRQASLPVGDDADALDEWLAELQSDSAVFEDDPRRLTGPTPPAQPLVTGAYGWQSPDSMPKLEPPDSPLVHPQQHGAEAVTHAESITFLRGIGTADGLLPSVHPLHNATKQEHPADSRSKVRAPLAASLAFSMLLSSTEQTLQQGCFHLWSRPVRSEHPLQSHGSHVTSFPMHYDMEGHARCRRRKPVSHEASDAYIPLLLLQGSGSGKALAAGLGRDDASHPAEPPSRAGTAAAQLAPRPSASPDQDLPQGGSDGAGGGPPLPSAAARAVREKARRQRLNDMCASPRPMLWGAYTDERQRAFLCPKASHQSGSGAGSGSGLELRFRVAPRSMWKPCPLYMPGTAGGGALCSFRTIPPSELVCKADELVLTRR